MLDQIKKQYKDLPHVTEVWIKDGECYLVAVKDAVKHSLSSEDTVEEETTTIKKSKKK